MTETEIINILDSLGIERQSTVNSKGWLGIKCPLPSHPGIDNHFGNCSVNLNSGAISCLACHGVGSINQLKENKLAVNSTVQLVPIKRKKKITKKFVDSKGNYFFTSLPLNPDDYIYTRNRGITQEFVDHFNIKRCVSGWFDDYMIIPIQDKEKGIIEFESRKLLLEERLRKFYNNTSTSFNRIKKQFKKDSLSLDEYDELLFYYNKGKVLYIPNSRIKETLWNIDNLDYNKPLYIVEGLGSVCKIWTYISRNITCTFGSKVTDKQVELLKRFKKVYIIPDYDDAGFQMVINLYYNNLKFIALSVKSDDNSTCYIEEINKKEEIDIKSLITGFYYTNYKK